MFDYLTLVKTILKDHLGGIKLNDLDVIVTRAILNDNRTEYSSEVKRLDNLKSILLIAISQDPTLGILEYHYLLTPEIKIQEFFIYFK